MVSLNYVLESIDSLLDISSGVVVKIYMFRILAGGCLWKRNRQ